MLSLTLALAVAGTGGVRLPDRLTAGAPNQFLGALSPDGKSIVYVSDEASTTQVWIQDVERGVPRLLFDELADVSWPRLSPDGSQILYISYQEDAAGDLCVRTLGEKVGPRRCLTDEKSAEVQAIWLADGKSIAVVTRSGLHGDFELLRIATGGARGEVVVRANLSTPAFSPDGHWLAYVPVERAEKQIGPSFLSRTGGSVYLARISGPRGAPQGSAERGAEAGGEPRKLAVDLPGATAFPAFSADGKWLYFTQFLNDTNLDGAIDGNDNGVLFRAPFSEGKLGPTDQLTTARWNCQYPMPAKERLVVTCLQRGSLDVYSLPLDGGVPPDWNAAKIDDEISASTDRWEKLLLYAHRPDPAASLPAMIQLHLELGEYESAAFYAGKLAANDPAAGDALRELAQHRKAERALGRGGLGGPFVADARARLERLAKIRHPIAAIARSEVLDTLGEEGPARAAIESLDLANPLIAALWADRILALYRGEAKYFELYQPLAERDLFHAQAFMRELLAGVPRKARTERIERWLKNVDPDGELAFLLNLELFLADLTPADQEPVRERVFAFYRQNKDFARRKALVGTTLRRALADDNEYILTNFATTWVSYVPRAKAERRRAERIFAESILERAYVERDQGNIGDARGRFYGVTLQTESLEAHAGFLEMRLREKKDPLADYKKDPNGAPARYARAYLLAKGIAGQKDLKRADADAAKAIAELAAIAEKAPQRAEVHQLWGYVAYLRWLRSGVRIHAVEANAHLLLALDLAAESPRHRAALLEDLGRLQSSVGNHAIAAGWFDERAKLPFDDDRAALAHCLARARAHFAINAPARAAELVDACPPDARYATLVLDRSALYHLVARHYPEAADRYARLWPLAEKQTGSDGTRNRLTVQVGWAAASLGNGQPDEALRHAAQAEKLLAAGPVPPREGAYGRERLPADATVDYPLLLLGLRAQAHLQRNELAEAEKALAARRDRLIVRYDDGELDEDLLDAVLAEAQLAKVAYDRKQPEVALAHLDRALTRWDQWSKNTNTPIEDLGLALLAGYAELHVHGGVALAKMKHDLPKRLQATYARLSELRNPAWEPMRERLELYLSLLDLRRQSR